MSLSTLMELAKIARSAGLNNKHVANFDPATQNAVHYMLGGGKPKTHILSGDMLEAAALAAASNSDFSISGGHLSDLRKGFPDYDPTNEAMAEAASRRARGVSPAPLNSLLDLLGLERSIGKNNSKYYPVGTSSVRGAIGLRLPRTGAVDSRWERSSEFYNTFGGYSIEHLPSGKMRVADSYRFYPNFESNNVADYEGGRDAFSIGKLQTAMKYAQELHAEGMPFNKALYTAGYNQIKDSAVEGFFSRYGKAFPTYSQEFDPPKGFFEIVKERIGEGYHTDLGLLRQGLPTMALTAMAPGIMMPAIGISAAVNDPYITPERAGANIGTGGVLSAAENDPTMAASLSTGANLLGRIAALPHSQNLPMDLLGIQDAAIAGGKDIISKASAHPIMFLMNMLGLATAGHIGAPSQKLGQVHPGAIEPPVGTSYHGTPLVNAQSLARAGRPDMSFAGRNWEGFFADRQKGASGPGFYSTTDPFAAWTWGESANMNRGEFAPPVVFRARFDNTKVQPEEVVLQRLREMRRSGDLAKNDYLNLSEPQNLPRTAHDLFGLEGISTGWQGGNRHIVHYNPASVRVRPVFPELMGSNPDAVEALSQDINAYAHRLDLQNSPMIRQMLDMLRVHQMRMTGDIPVNTVRR